MDGFFVAKLKKTSNSKPAVPEPSEPSEKTQQAEIIDDNKDVQLNIPNGKPQKPGVLKMGMKKKNTDFKSGIQNNWKLKKLRNSKPAGLETYIPSEKREQAAVIDDDSKDVQNISNGKTHKLIVRKKGMRKKNTGSRSGTENNGKMTPSSTAKTKKKRKFPSKEEISQAREEKRKALKKRGLSCKKVEGRQ